MAGPANTVNGDLAVAGTITALDIDYPQGSIENVDVKSTAGIAASKQEHQHAIRARQVGTSTSETIPLYSVLGATATVREVAVGNVVACIGAATVVVDIKKNGTTILSSTIELNSTTPVANDMKHGTISVEGAVLDDVFSAVVTATAGGGTLATGVLIELRMDEDYTS